MNPTAHRTAPPATRPAAVLLAVLVVVLLAVLPLVGSATTARAAVRDDPAPSRAEVFRALSLERQPADYVVLVDVSGSMAKEGRYDTVRQTLRTFLGGLAPTDHVALYTLGTTVVPRYIGAAADPAGVLAALPAAPERNGYTDIGAAFEAGLRELERSEALRVASVVLLTDGENEPPPDSAFPLSTTAGWTAALHERAAKVATRASLVGYALPLATGATGAQLLRQVVPDTRELAPSSIQDLGAYLQRAGDDTRLRQARLLLAADRGKGVSAAWTGPPSPDLTGGEVSGTVTFTSRTAKLPLTVRDLAVAVPGDVLGVSGMPDTLTLAPGESRSVEVRITGHLDAGRLGLRESRQEEVRLRLSGTVSSPWQSTFGADLPLEVPAAVDPAELPVRLSATVGSAAALPLLVGVPALVVLLVVLVLVRTRWPVLGGFLVVEPVFGGRVPERIALRGRRVRIRPMAGGSGLVRGRRKLFGRRESVILVVRYSPDGSAGRASSAVCAPDRRVVVAGLAFSYQRSAAGRPGGVR
ncbi:VWA domain-containing protein [Kitasatospora sp. NPDC051853]|uniref:vWA domain-containing protein n=1 Tax=Kitasatospora sp. NPDC051853 TaxID=3364058 RepID=UPI0037B312A7